MVGGSYGGGIQLVTAATDCRVDAIVPTIAWHSLATSLDKAEHRQVRMVGAPDQPVHLRPRRPGGHRRLPRRAARPGPSPRPRPPGSSPGARPVWSTGSPCPTLFVQGTVDTLFTLQEARRQLQVLRARASTTSMLWFCGGHGVCLTDPGDAAAARAGHAGLAEAVRATRHLGTHRARVPVRRPERHRPTPHPPTHCRHPAVHRDRLGHTGPGVDGRVGSAHLDTRRTRSSAPWWHRSRPAPATNAVDVPVPVPPVRGGRRCPAAGRSPTTGRSRPTTGPPGCSPSWWTPRPGWCWATRSPRSTSPSTGTTTR